MNDNEIITSLHDLFNTNSNIQLYTKLKQLKQSNSAQISFNENAAELNNQLEQVKIEYNQQIDILRNEQLELQLSSIYSTDTEVNLLVSSLKIQLAQVQEKENYTQKYYHTTLLKYKLFIINILEQNKEFIPINKLKHLIESFIELTSKQQIKKYLQSDLRNQ